MVVWSVSYSCCFPWLRECPIIVFNVKSILVMLSLSRTKVSKLARGVAIIMRVVCAGGEGLVVQVAEHRPVGSGQCTRVHHHNQQQVNHPLDAKERSLQLPEEEAVRPCVQARQ